MIAIKVNFTYFYLCKAYNKIMIYTTVVPNCMNFIIYFGNEVQILILKCENRLF